ncbi:MAG: crotonase/enoyl-CoA hydratase family protein [Ilumatobacteraceae bacterium]|nr:crotonase/enoyl-CoA hydratase family protein [Ilumatobacteraceae bacterium]
MSDRVTVNISDGIADVRFNRAEKRNALDGEQFSAIVEAGESLKTNKSIRVVVLSGEGASFCAGLDLASMGAIANGSSASQDRQPQASDMQEGRITHLGQQSAWVWQEVPVPVIAALHGHALGAGCQIALGADIRIAHPDTKFSVRETYWGLVPDCAGTVLLQGLVRPDVIKDIVFTARIFDGREAHEIGVVTRLSENPLDDAFAYAAEICKRSPDAVRGAKELLNRMTVEYAAAQFAAERRIIGGVIGGHNQREAVMSDFEKRPPSYIDAK